MLCAIELSMQTELFITCNSLVDLYVYYRLACTVASKQKFGIYHIGKQRILVRVCTDKNKRLVHLDTSACNK